ncbi:uncharacterized protein LY79DRAFT_550329 [Colletotrichum navitas]|uniref:Uncharacterized protein n=1 Tax=Colletotrichum navitas TaxID=681940 RepID=A0AAD8V6U3_9PEZI|nr:uncharacterized protein LY79DRAFT_550329 [Colletotrichum navitas]KAK1593931.1 hypothetical protein LY79DRAFT_550329 [Colletotrichum navitas]
MAEDDEVEGRGRKGPRGRNLFLTNHHRPRPPARPSLICQPGRQWIPRPAPSLFP